MEKRNFNQGRAPPIIASPSPSQVTALFACYAAGGIQIHDLPLACNLFYHHTTLSIVSILHFFLTYYTKSSVNCLFVALNKFKLKSCQLQSFITF